MKNKILISLVVSFFVFGNFSFAEKNAPKKDKKITPVSVKPTLTEQEAIVLKENALEILRSHPWIINLTLQGVEKPVIETDVLTFANGEVSSENLIAKGFSKSQFSLNVNEDKTITWETVQKDPKGSIAMWRGEVKKDSLFGTLTILKGGTVRMYSFNSIATKEPSGVKIEQPYKTEE